MKNSIFRAVFTLTAFSVIDRTLGFILKIYLSNQLGAVGIGIYQVAISVFFVLLTFTTSGIPLIVAKITAKNSTLKQDSYATATAALIIEIVVAITVCVLLFTFRKSLENFFATKSIMRLVVILLPAFLASSIYAAFRGHLWGKECYTAVSLTEIAENLVRIAVCVSMFSLGFNKLNAAAMSLSVACIASCIICIIVYFAKKGKLSNPKKHFAPLIKSALPITGVRVAESLVSSITALCVPFLLVSSGSSLSDALSIFGSSIGMAFPLLLIPITVVSSLAYVLIPSLSTSAASGKSKEVCSQVEKSISFSITIAAIFVPVFWALGKHIGIFVYGNEFSGAFLSVSAWLLIPIALESITSSMLNSLDTEMMGFLSFIIGSVVLFGVLFAFYGHFSAEIIVLSMALSKIVSTAVNIFVIRKKTKMALSFLKPLIICSILILPATVFTFCLFSLLNAFPLFFSLAITSVFSIAFMLIFYRLFNLIPKISRFMSFTKKQKNMPEKSLVTLEEKSSATDLKKSA